MKLFKQKTFRNWAFVLVSSSIFYGCNLGDIPNLDNIYLPNYEGEIAIVLVKDTLNMSEFLNESISDSSAILDGPNQEVIFQYQTDAEFAFGDNFIEIKSFSNSEYIDSPIDFFFVTPKDTTLTIQSTFVFDFPSENQEQIDSVFYESGLVKLTVESEFPGELNYDFSVNSFVRLDNQESLALSATLPSTNSTVSNEQTASLAGYKTILVNEADSNKFEANVAVTINIPQGTALSGAESVYFTLDVVDPEFQGVFGYFGQDTIDIAPRRISLGLFDDFTGTGIDFESPTISLLVENTFGIPMSIDFSKVFAQYDDGDDLLFSGEISENPVTIDAPTPEEYSNPLKTTSIEIGPDNSNLRELLSSTPERLVFPLVGYSNLGSTEANFIALDSEIKIQALMQLPLSLRLEDFEYEQEVELELDELSQTKELSLQFRTLNELPFDGEVDIIFMDDLGNPIDSIANNVVFVAPSQYDAATGKALEPSTNVTTIELNTAKIESLTSASSLVLVTRLNSFGNTSGDFVTIFSDYQLLTTVSVLGKVSIDLNNSEN